MLNHNLQSLSESIMDLAREKGFGTKPEEINALEKIALIHSEVSEACEAYRKNNLDGKDGFAEELADAMIRIMHLAGVFSIDLEQEMLKKIKTNYSRSWDNLNEIHSKKINVQ